MQAMRRRDIIASLSALPAIWPLVSRAQQKAVPVIGFLGTGSPGPFASRLAAFHQGLGETGYVKGQNLAIESRWAEGDYDRLAGLAADLIGRKVDAIVTLGPAAGRAAKNATSTIPIVFISGSDPVAMGLVTSLARPGGNITGVSWLAVELMPKLFELLFELVPQTGAVALLVNPSNPGTERQMEDVQEAARTKGVRLQIVKASTESQIDAAFTLLVEQHVGAVVVGSDPFFGTRHEQLVTLAARHSIPAIYDNREYAMNGGLIGYGTNLSTLYRLLGIYAGRVLKGEKPADLPVQQPTKFELVINLNTAKALGLTVPQSLLQRADEIIE